MTAAGNVRRVDQAVPDGLTASRLTRSASLDDRGAKIEAFAAELEVNRDALLDLTGRAILAAVDLVTIRETGAALEVSDFEGLLAVLRQLRSEVRADLDVAIDGLRWAL